MASVADWPRGWTFSQRVSTFPSQAIITVPACPRVSHVLTEVSGSLFNNPAGTSLDVVAEVAGLFGINNPLFEITDAGTAAFTLVTGSWSGKIVAPESTALVVEFNGAAATWVQTLVIQGYDI